MATEQSNVVTEQTTVGTAAALITDQGNRNEMLRDGNRETCINLVIDGCQSYAQVYILSCFSLEVFLLFDINNGTFLPTVDLQQKVD